ncbi:hypothetical protein [Aquimarina sp. 2201CG5-10]|uniref:hypothetical protein n=1 Tax=Aquimarina callyspongiae TaxID=3098150 RepID=UPI002AB52161|nr:hypothetical protein [Aquimarina sp. 2201CG5-10]MDY8135494.1 hypothetical protein [Aquimarina sp. 2201CG5-10]
MRRVINLSLLIVAIVFSNLAKASEVLSVEILNSSMINVSLSNITKGEKLYLKDYNGEILFNATLDAMPAYQKYFNLSNVPDGVYFVETETVYEIKVTPVLKNKKGISLIKNSAVTVFKPVVKSKNKLVKIMLSNPEKSSVTIQIYDKEDILLIEESSTDEVLKRVFDFSTMPSETYRILFKQKERTFIKEVSI